MEWLITHGETPFGTVGDKYAYGSCVDLAYNIGHLNWHNKFNDTPEGWVISDIGKKYLEKQLEEDKYKDWLLHMVVTHGVGNLYLNTLGTTYHMLYI